MSRLYPPKKPRKVKELVICFECQQIMLSDRKRKGQRDSWCLGYTKNVTEKELMEKRHCGKFEP